MSTTKERNVVKNVDEIRRPSDSTRNTGSITERRSGEDNQLPI